DEPDVVLTRDLPETVGVGTRHLERLARELRVRALGARVGPACEELRPGGARIGGHEGLREDDELRALALRLRGQRSDLVDRPGAVEDRRLGLDAGGAARLFHRAYTHNA